MMKYSWYISVFLAILASTLQTSHARPIPKEPTEKPTEPTECNADNKGRCPCGNKSKGFTTYTFWINERQRCFHVFRLLTRVTERLPVLMTMQCYGKDRLKYEYVQMTSNSSLANKLAERYGYSRFGLSTPGGNWGPNIQKTDKGNGTRYWTPCSAEESPHYGYLKKYLTSLQLIQTFLTRTKFILKDFLKMQDLLVLQLFVFLTRLLEYGDQTGRTIVYAIIQIDQWSVV